MDDFIAGPTRDLLYNVLNEATKVYKKPEEWKPLEKIPDELKTDRPGTARIVGAAGIPMLIPAQYLKTMTDPYSHLTRDDFADCVYTDPILAPAIDRRHDALFEDGFTLEFELRSEYDAQGDPLTPEMVNAQLREFATQYNQYLIQIRNWAEHQNLKQRMQEVNITSLVQGRSAIIITPGISELIQGSLPMGMQIVHYDDLHEPIVDVGLTQRVVALNVSYHDKHILRPDEVIYIVRKNLGLRRESLQYGASILESVVAMSRLVKRIYHFDIPDAIISSYLTRVIFKFATGGPDSADITRKMQDFLAEMTKPGKTVYGVTHAIEDIKPIEVKANADLMAKSEMLLAERMMSIIGIPKSMLNRQQNLNRDLATMEFVQFLKTVRKPDERLISHEFEEQLLNPLLASLSGMNINDLPVRIAIKSKSKDLTTDLVEDKTNDVNTEMENTLGAAGSDVKKNEMNEHSRTLNAVLRALMNGPDVI